MSLKNAFVKTQDNLLSRRWGGHNTGVADPYITGYHFIWFDLIPTGLTMQLAQDGDNSVAGSLDMIDVQKTLAACCVGVTPPGGTLNKVEFVGLGGVKWAVPGSIDYGNSISIKFLEMQGLPITTIMHKWVKAIRDYRYGVTSIMQDTDGLGYSKKTYSALLYYWTTAPDGKTIEYYACYDGVFPTKDPSDLQASDLESIGKLDIEIEFNVDYAWHEQWVYNKCQSFASTLVNSKNVIDSYGNQNA